MKALLETLVSQAPSDIAFGAVFVIGAGRGIPLQDIRALRPRELIIAEPRTEAAQAVQQRLVSGKERLLPQAVIAGDDATIELHVPSNPRYSSVREPTALLRHFPNLQSAHTHEVEAISITEALESLQLNDEEQHVLIIAAPGSAAALLESAPTKLLRAFSWIILNSADEPLYDGDTSLPALNLALAGLGYDSYAEDSDTLPPFTTALFRRNATVVALAQAQAELDELRQHLAFRDAEVQSRTEERDAAIREKVELGEKLDYAKAMLAEEHASKQALQLSLDELNRAKADAGDERQRLAAALSQAQEALASSESQRGEALNKLESEQAASQAARVDAQSARASLSEARSGLEDLKRQLAAAASENTETARKLDATRVQLETAESTMEELETRYKTALAQLEIEKKRFIATEQELVKASAHLTLIKELLLTRPESP